MLGAARGYEIEGNMGGPADILMWEGPVGPRVALTHHTLANKVDPAHDEEGEDDADDRPDGTAVGRGIIGGWLGDLCQKTDKTRQWTLGAKEQAHPWGWILCALKGLVQAQHPLGRGRCWGAGAPHDLSTTDTCPPGLPGAPLPSSSPTTLPYPLPAG